jgi:hypothetical protein
MENRRPPLTAEAQTTVSMTAAAVVTAILGLAFFLAGAGIPVLIMAILLTATTGIFALQSWKQTRRHGWRTFGDDDGEDGPRGGGGGGGPVRPPEPEGPPGGTEIDWEQFSREFWAHVSSRERVVL